MAYIPSRSKSLSPARTPPNPLYTQPPPYRLSCMAGVIHYGLRDLSHILKTSFTSYMLMKHATPHTSYQLFSGDTLYDN